ncbi:MAG: ABC transporter permease [Candidatus Eiseniibacteriota bacterium]
MARTLKERLRPLRASAWLGFQIESNWSDPIVFAVYALAKPVATALILLVMYQVVVGGPLADPRFVALYVGNALYIYVILLLVGLSWAVFEDREQYKMLKYVAATPVGLVPYLLGRSFTKWVLATASALVVLVFGVTVLGMRLSVTPASALGGLVALALGSVGIVAVGLVLSGLALVFARQSMMMNEGVAAVLYLFCGVVFPPDLLPGVLRAVAFSLPITYWMEASRRALGAPGFSAIMSRWSALELSALFLAVTLVWVALGLFLFRRLEERARRQGLLDITTAW